LLIESTNTHIHTHAARSVLVFGGGRNLKLSGFGSAVPVGEATTTMRGNNPSFAAPEVIKGEVPRFSADIWSVLCILVEMLTARWPGCQQVVRSAEAMMFLVSLHVNVCA
jgi:serine/threonine protein kinase